VVEDVRVLAPGVLEGIRQDGHGGEVAGLVHPANHRDGGRGTPVRVERDRDSGVSENVAGNVALGSFLVSDQPQPLLVVFCKLTVEVIVRGVNDAAFVLIPTRDLTSRGKVIRGHCRCNLLRIVAAENILILTGCVAQLSSVANPVQKSLVSFQSSAGSFALCGHPLYDRSPVSFEFRRKQKGEEFAGWECAVADDLAALRGSGVNRWDQIPHRATFGHACHGASEMGSLTYDLGIFAHLTRGRREFGKACAAFECLGEHPG
jgi:hypothetical protein